MNELSLRLAKKYERRSSLTRRRSTAIHNGHKLRKIY